MEQRIEISSNIQNIQKVEQLIDDISNQLNLDKTIYGNILISVFEAVNNAIIHGNRKDEGKIVSIDLIYDDDHHKINVYVKDEGEGFNYYNLPDPTADDNINHPSGRGIFLMKQLSDDIIFHDNGSKVELNFKL